MPRRHGDIGETSGDRWYVVHARPAKEALARDNLERQGFAVFLPQIARTVRHARRTTEVLRPLFPRYLFVSFDVGRDRWHAVRGTLGVSALLMDGERPRPAPVGLVEDLVATDAAGRAGELPLAPGAEVRFQRGPFAEQIGRIVEMSDVERVRVLMEILGSTREVDVDARTLRPV